MAASSGVERSVHSIRNVIAGTNLPSLVADTILAMEMKPAPINPEWITDSNPEARVCAILQRSAINL